MQTLVPSQIELIRTVAEGHLDVHNAEQVLRRAESDLAGAERLLRRSGTARKLEAEPRTVPVNEGAALVTVRYTPSDEQFHYAVSRPI